jgi:cytochrome c peroxidase
MLCLSMLWPADLARLGRKLFQDRRLSADGTVSCATCHDPRRAFADDKPLAVGVQGRKGERHTPTLVARGAGELQFWDGRAATLEDQVLQPIENPKEMDAKVDQVVERLRPDYPDLNATLLRNALAAYLRLIRSVDSPVDRFLRGEDGALSSEEREGFRLFRDRARCYVCHSGAHFTDEQFHNTGVAWRNGRLRDEGRGAVTGKPYHRGAFKTPTLREIANTAPYMHDGSFATLEDVVEFYDRGGRRNPYLDENIVALKLSPADKRAIVAFLRKLSGTVRDEP